MIYWAFLLCVVFVPGYTGMTIPTGWAFLSITLPFLIWRGPALAWPLQALGLGLLGFAAASVAWSVDRYDAVYGYWMFAVIAMSYVLGYKLPTLDGIRRGLALGLSVSSFLCIPQWLGWHPVMAYSEWQPVGLLYNPSTAALAFVALALWLVLRRDWLYIPALLPGLLLNHTRTGWMALAGLALVALIQHNRRFALLLIPIAVIAGLWLTNLSDSDAVRLHVWRSFATHLSLLGAGIGGSTSVVLNIQGIVVMPEYAHNEFLDLAYQLGLAALPLFALAAIPLSRPRTPEWYVYVLLLIACLYSYPLHIPVLAFTLAALAGHLSRGWSMVWANGHHWRPTILHRPGIA